MLARPSKNWVCPPEKIAVAATGGTTETECFIPNALAKDPLSERALGSGVGNGNGNM